MNDAETVQILKNELEKLGIDITTEEGRADFRANIKWSRDNRRRCESSSRHALFLLIGGTMWGVGQILWSYLKPALKGFL